MNLLYYYYFLFYTNIIPDDEPHATTIFTLSLSESFLINGVSDIISVNLFCAPMNKWLNITIFLLIALINYFLYFKSGKGKEIVTAKPKIFNSKTLSIIIVSLFFISSAYFFIWVPNYLKQMLEHCK